MSERSTLAWCGMKMNTSLGEVSVSLKSEEAEVALTPPMSRCAEGCSMWQGLTVAALGWGCMVVGVVG